jgi:hypothetical protein
MTRSTFVNDSFKAGFWSALLCGVIASACQTQAGSGDEPEAHPAVAVGSKAPPGTRVAPAPACDPSKQFCGDSPEIKVDPATIVAPAAGPHAQRLAKVQSPEALLAKHRELPDAVVETEAVRATPPETLQRQALYLEKARELGQVYSGEELAQRKLDLKRSLFPQSTPASVER